MIYKYFRGKQSAGLFLHFPNASYGKKYHESVILLDQPLREFFYLIL